jgi:hypothetical protein
LRYSTQICFFRVRQPRVEMAVVMVDHVGERGEAAVVIEAAFSAREEAGSSRATSPARSFAWSERGNASISTLSPTASAVCARSKSSPDVSLSDFPGTGSNARASAARERNVHSLIIRLLILHVCMLIRRRESCGRDCLVYVLSNVRTL